MDRRKYLNRVPAARQTRSSAVRGVPVKKDTDFDLQDWAGPGETVPTDLAENPPTAVEDKQKTVKPPDDDDVTNQF